MSPLTFLAFLTGPAGWRPPRGWHPFVAALVAIAVIVIGQLVPILVLQRLGIIDLQHGNVGQATDKLAKLPPQVSASVLLLTQATLALLTLLAVRLRRTQPTDALSLGPPEGGLRAFGFAFVVMVPLLAVFNAAAWWLARDGFLADFRIFADLARAANPAAAFLAIAVGAPLWEEMLFRGLLLAPISLAIGFWPATILVSGAWATLHIGYSMAGLAEVFVIGIYFAWALRQTGSLWVPIICHGTYNALLFIALRYLPV